MGERRRYTGSEYISSSTVRKLQTAPDYEKERYDRYRQETERKRRHKKRRAQSMDFASVLFLTAAIAVTVYACSGYLSVQADITGMNKKIAAIQKEIMNLESQNTVVRERINEYVDLDYVYKVATKELKMVHPKENQIISYESTKSDLVRQYGEIPSGKKGNVLEKALGK